MAFSELNRLKNLDDLRESIAGLTPVRSPPGQELEKAGFKTGRSHPLNRSHPRGIRTSGGHLVRID
ncbi:hypothetical protein [Oscillatoria sp. HE19RPO]|uniref:hypothetical protein n=1 Tax=Oscillatoria sp. HE19RPO TaxID=2954806 RepID=UPI0020C1E108|nr:hypothetical protein [Oscillatoria sp. HE19RPO]